MLRRHIFPFHLPKKPLLYKYSHPLIQPLFLLRQASFLQNSSACSVAALCVHQTCVSLLLRSAKEQVVLSLSLSLSAFVSISCQMLDREL